MRKVFLVLSALMCSPLASFATEAVHLKSGFSLVVDSHSVENQTLICRVGKGTLEFPSDQIETIEILPSGEQTRMQPAISGKIEAPEALVNQAANLAGLDEDFVRSVAKVESGFQQKAVSSKGAIGLMQLMPSTASRLGVNPEQAAENASGGAKYLRELLIQYHGNSALALAAYNAGPEAVAKYHGVPPYPETRSYVLKVLEEYQRRLKTNSRTSPGTQTANRSSATN